MWKGIRNSLGPKIECGGVGGDIKNGKCMHMLKTLTHEKYACVHECVHTRIQKLSGVHAPFIYLTNDNILCQ